MALLSFGSRSQQPNKLGSIQVSTSEYGVVKPYGAGTFKAPIKLLDYTDFVAKKVDAGGKGGGGSYSYEYYAAVDALVCTGPCAGTGNFYDGGGSSQLLGASETFTIGGNGGSYTVQHAGRAFYYDEGCTTSAAYNYTANDYGSDGVVTIAGTHAVPLQKLSSGSALVAGQYSVSIAVGSAGTYVFSNADAGKTVTVTYSYTTADTSKGGSSLSPIERYALGFISGTRPGTPWGYMQTMHPERALSYPGLNRINSNSLDLGSSATTPSLSVEILNNRNLAFGGGIADCDPAAIIADILTDPIDGCNWPHLGDLSQFSNFCVANNLFMSPFLDSQRKATDVIKEFCTLANAEPVWSGAVLNIVPYGDTSIANNGRTFTPATEPDYNFLLSDLVCKEGEEPVKSSWNDLADNYNRIEMEYTRREASYNTGTLRAQDEASIAQYGRLPAQTISAHHFCERDYAAVSMDMLLKRNAVPLRQHEFTLKWWYFLLEPMKIVTFAPGIVDAGITPMRIVSIEEQEDYTLKVIAEDFKWGVGAGVLYPKGSGAGNGPGAHDLPGNTQVLAAFQPSTRLTGGGAELWLALSGGASWGGCRVWLSVDGSTFSVIGRQYGAARSGSLTGPLAAGADPDTANTASIVVSGSLTSVSQADADAFGTISLLGSELVSYETATLTGSGPGTDSYNLGYLRRGIFSSGIQAHSAGETFVRLDGQVFRYPFDPTLLGKTVQLKFTSLNLYGQEEQALSDVSPRFFTLGAAGSSSTMTVASIVDPADNTHAILEVYETGASTSTAGSTTLPNGAVIALPAASFSGKALGTFYALNFNPSTSAYMVYTDANAWMADQNTGLIPIGSTTTPTAASASSGSYLPTRFSDLGASPTSNPAGAYAGAGASATVSSYATFTPGTSGSGRQYDQTINDGSGEGDAESADGNFEVLGFAGVLTADKTLSLTAAVTTSTRHSGSSHVAVSYTLDGSTWTNFLASTVSLASAAYSVAVPSGTNLANVAVQATCYSVTSSSGSYASSSEASLTLSNIVIS